MCRCIGECTCKTVKLTTNKRLDRATKALAEFKGTTAKEFKEVAISLKEVNFLIDACRVDLQQAIDAIKGS